MQFPADRKYSEFHVWAQRRSADLLLGLSEFAGQELGEVTYLELPEPNAQLTRDEPFGVAETSKAIVELTSPVSGRVVRTNTELSDDPAALFKDPYGAGWLLVVAPLHPEEFDALMPADSYESLVLS